MCCQNNNGPYYENPLQRLFATLFGTGAVLEDERRYCNYNCNCRCYVIRKYTYYKRVPCPCGCGCPCRQTCPCRRCRCGTRRQQEPYYWDGGENDETCPCLYGDRTETFDVR